jgi:hypothetical protein
MSVPKADTLERDRGSYVIDKTDACQWPAECQSAEGLVNDLEERQMVIGYWLLFDVNVALIIAK